MTEKTKRGRLESFIERAGKRAQKDGAYRKRMIVVWALALAIWTGAMFYLAQVIVSVIAYAIVSQTGPVMNENILQTVCMTISYFAGFALTILPPAIFLKTKITRDGLGLNGLPTWTDILLAPIGYIVSMVAAIAVIMAVQAFVPTFDLSEAQDTGFQVFTNTDKIVAFAALVVLAPIAEELIFRGYLYGKLRTRLSAVPAIIIVSVLFGFMHGQWNVGIVVGIMSVFLCIARELTGTIYSGILMHMIRNGLAFYLLYVSPINVGGATGMLNAAAPILALFLI